MSSTNAVVLVVLYHLSRLPARSKKTRKFSIIEGENVPKKGRKEELITDLNGNEVPLVNKTKPNGKIVDQEMTKPKTNKPKWAHYLKNGLPQNGFQKISQ